MTVTRASLKGMKVKGGPNISREELLDGLANNALFLKQAGRSVKTLDPMFIPILACKTPLKDIFDINLRDCALQLQETWDVSTWHDYMLLKTFRKENAMILGNALKTAGGRKQHRAGRLTADDKKTKEEMQKRKLSIFSLQPAPAQSDGG